MPASKRELMFDYAKFFLILLVILDHIQLTNSYLDIWPLIAFFFISGYFYKRGRRTLGEFAKNRFQRLIIPFWAALLVNGLFELFRANYFGYCDSTIIVYPLLHAIWGSNFVPVPSFLDLSFLSPIPYREVGEGFIEVGTPSTGLLWFLPALFSGSIMFYVYQEKLRRAPWFDAIAIPVLLLLTFCETLVFGSVQLPWGIGRGFFVCACMIVGRDIKDVDLFNKPRVLVPVAVVCLAVYVWFDTMGWIVAAFIPSFYGTMDFPELITRYVPRLHAAMGSPGVFSAFVGCGCATIAFLALMKLFTRIVKICKPLLYIGESTMAIYLWHIPCITLFAVAFKELFGMPITLEYWLLPLIPAEYVGFKLIAIAGSIGLCVLLNYAAHGIQKRLTGSPGYQGISAWLHKVGKDEVSS
jgi:fucose 4-O-acetylase-like acetyltransferase